MCDCLSITLRDFVFVISVYIITSKSFGEDDIYNKIFIHAFYKSKYSSRKIPSIVKTYNYMVFHKKCFKVWTYYCMITITNGP